MALLATALLAGHASAARPQSVAPRAIAAALARVYGEGVRTDTLRVDTARVLRVARHDTLLGYALVREVRGREEPITVLIATDPALALADVDILEYREAYGGEVAYQSWRRQFRGRGPGDSLRVGREIRGISGATISVNAVTLGIRRALTDLAAWRRSGALR